MGKLRVYELAKELSMESREVIRRLEKMGLELKNHMSTVDDKFADSLREMVKPNPKKTEYTFHGTDSSVKKPGQNVSAQKVGEVNKPQQFDNQRRDYQSRTANPRSNQNQENKSEVRPSYNPNNVSGGKPNYPNNPSNANSGRPSYPANPNNTNSSRPNYPTNPSNASGGRPNYPSNPGNANSGRPNYPVNPNNASGARPNSPNSDRPSYPVNANSGKPNFQNRPNNFGGNQPKRDEGAKTTTPTFVKPGSQKNMNQKQKEQGKVKNVEKEVANKNNNSRFPSNQPGQKDNFRAGSRKKPQNKRFKKNYQQKMDIPPVVPKKVIIGETVTVQELAKSMGKTAAELIKKLMEMGVLATINKEIDADIAVLIGVEVGIPVEIRLDKTMEMMDDIDDDDDEKHLVERPPVVTVMGHVDHGKTSLLDAIKESNVTATEAGGITQHIGAYQVDIANKKITFLDTPGHEAFTAMRARGAQVTDIAIIVVAADDGVMPQTVEAINHSKAAKVPIIVAINKIDRPNANPDKVKQELTEYGLVAEEWGGDTIMAPVSAKTHEGISQLLEMILLVAEVAELKVNPERVVRGTVIEAELDKGRGPVATLLVQKGTLRIGDNIVAGTSFGKVRAMLDDKGRRVKSAGPSTPVVVLGFSDVPPVGEPFVGVLEEKDARYIAGKYQIKKREEELNKTARVSLDDLFKQIAEGIVKDLNVIVKGDVQGSIEALNQSLSNLSTNEVRVNTIHSGVGTITESDVMLAATSNAIIIGFNVRPDTNIRKIAENEKVDIKLYRVIYEAIDDVKAAMTGLLDPTFKEVVIGHAEVRTTFKVPKIGIIAGCYLTDGKITRQADVRVVRDGIVIHEGHIDSLKRFKDDVKEVQTGYECGIGLENFNDLKDGDIIEGYIMEEIKRVL